MKVLICCPYPEKKAPSQRFRFEQYLDLLQNVAFNQVGFWEDDEWPRIYEDGSIKYKVVSTMRGFGRRLRLLFQVRQYDKVFVHREATPIGPPWFEWAVAKVFRKPIIFDFDDAIWLPNSSKANEKTAGRLKFHGKTAKICSWATTVVTGNEFLAEYARQYCDDVRVIPTTIDTERHHNRELYVRKGSKWIKKSKNGIEPLAVSRWPLADDLDSDNLDTKKADGKMTKDVQKSTESSITEYELTAKSLKLKAHSNVSDQANSPILNPKNSQQDTVSIGWTGTHSTLKQLTPLFPLLEEVHRKFPFRFLLIADVPPETMPEFVEFRKWKKETEIEDLLEMDIGVMPLYDTEWEKGKCGFKALQYLALGIPVVLSKVGVNTEIIQNENQGLLCEPMPLTNSDSLWKQVLTKFLKREDFRKKSGLEGKKQVIANFSVARYRTEYSKLFQRL